MKGKTRKARIEIGVVDSGTARRAETRAHRSVWGAKQGEYSGRDVRVEIEIPTSEAVTADSPAFIRCSVDCFTCDGNGNNTLVSRKVRIDDAQLGDIPLLILALQEVLRVGVVQGSFPDVSK